MRYLTAMAIMTALLIPTNASAEPANLHHQDVYTIKAGDTLVEIGEKLDVRWRRIFDANPQVKHQDRIEVGDTLKIPANYVELKRRKLKPTIVVVPPRPVAGASRSSDTYTPSTTGTSNNDSTNAYVDPWGCEADHAQQWNPSGKYWGKYQFDRQTWAAHGGDPGAYGSASEAEQDRVAGNVKYDAWPNC